MSGKGNLKVWRVGIAVVLLLGGVGWFLYSKWELNNQKLEELKQKYAQNNAPTERKATHAPPSDGESERKSSVVEQPVVDRLNITFRAIGLNRMSPEADKELVFNVLNEMKNSEYFDSANTRAVGNVSPEVPLTDPPVKSEHGDPPGTFSFKIVAKLKRPLTL
jgi:hypothetical protein